MKTILTILFLGMIFTSFNAQTINKPSVQVKSHPTLNIIKIEQKETETIFFMHIVNRIKEGGWFCVDKNVKLTSEGFKEDIRMIRSENIENCPTSHQFTKLNESKSFRLYFPPIPAGVTEVNLVEECSDNCFYMNGIVLDQVLNNEIKSFDMGLSLYSKNDFRGSLQYFIDIRDNSIHTDRKHYGYSMYIIPLIYHKLDEPDSAKRAYKKLKENDFKDKDYFIMQLKKIDFFKDLK